MSQVAAEPAMTLMTSRRRIASPKAWDYFDLAFNTAITAGIRERLNGFGGLFVQQQLRAGNVRLGSKATDLRWQSIIRSASNSDQTAALHQVTLWARSALMLWRIH